MHKDDGDARTGTAHCKGRSLVTLENCLAEPEGLSADAEFQLSTVWICGATHCQPVQARLQVAADGWVGIVQRQAAEAKCCQNHPDPQRSHLSKPMLLLLF